MAAPSLRTGTLSNDASAHKGRPRLRGCNKFAGQVFLFALISSMYGPVVKTGERSDMRRQKRFGALPTTRHGLRMARFVFLKKVSRHERKYLFATYSFYERMFGAGESE